ncbi:MAG: lipocalin family protein [Ignavibacteriae bacterium]|nr:lipocalin family protein [Ignavibacteriota bacterium]
MKTILAALTLFSITIFAQQNSSKNIATVDFVDLKKYVGTWYEIAKIPNSFQDHCIKNTTASYKINEDGDIEVLNQCVDDEGEIDGAEGVARIVDKKTNSKLEVSFVSILGWNLFWGDYWILGLDGNYKFAVIGTPSRKYGWILSRTKKMNENDLEKCFKIFEENGYDRNKFELDVHDN